MSIEPTRSGKARLKAKLVTLQILPMGSKVLGLHVLGHGILSEVASFLPDCLNFLGNSYKFGTLSGTHFMR